MRKIVLFSNIFPFYSKAFWTLLIKRIDNLKIGIQFEDNRGIKLVDITKTFSKQHQRKFFKIKNILLKNKHLIYQFGVIPRAIFWEIDKAVFLGDAKVISTWIASIILRIRGIEVIFWTHGFYGKENYIKLFIRRLFYSLSNKFIVYERRGKELMISHGFKSNKIYVIFNSLDYDLNNKIFKKLLLKNNNSTSLNFKDPSKPIVCFIGRLTPQKKLDLLIKAINIINKDDYKINLLIIGEGYEKEKLKNLAFEGLEKNQVFFCGEVYDNSYAGQLLFDSSLCVSPGNVGLTAIHSLSFGTPVLTHNNYDNQMPEVQAIVEGINGGFFNENDLNDLVKKIKYFTLSNNKISKEKCRGVIEDFYNPDYMFQTFGRLVNNENPLL